MFGRRSKTEYDSRPTTDRAAPATADGRPDALAYRTWYGPTRAVMTLIGAACALLLIWLATQIGTEDNPAYWAALGLVAGAGLVMAFSQLLGGWTKFGIPRISGNVLLLAFVPTLVVTGWILLAHQPDTELFRNDVRGWSDDVGLLGFVMDFRNFLPALAFLTGLTFGFSFDTTGPRTRTAVRRDEDVVERGVEGPVAVPAARSGYDEDAVTQRRVEGPVAVPAAQRDDDGDGYADDRYDEDAVTQRRVEGPVAVPAAQRDDDGDGYADDRYTDEPSTAERREVADDGNGARRGLFGRRRSRDTEYSSTQQRTDTPE
jgi:hypothetical protein